MTDRPTPELLLASKRCSQCLTTRNRIVPGKRAAQIIEGCKETRNHFICHKGSEADMVVHCRGVHDLLNGSRAHDFAQTFDIPIREIDPDEIDAKPSQGKAA